MARISGTSTGAAPAKSAAKSSLKKKAPATGAPAQHAQSSRKGKRAWRKHVDIGDVEAGLEGLRAEERVLGTTLQKKTDDDLFVIDVTGDAQVRRALPRFAAAELSYAKTLAARSAVPAVLSRPHARAPRRAGTVSREDKDRLLRTARRLRRGPLNSLVAAEAGAGSAAAGVSAAVRAAGAYDAWAADPTAGAEVPDGLEAVRPRAVKPPAFAHPRDHIELPAIPEPHQGTSYNPPAAAHQELLLQAHEIEERRAREAARLAALRERIEQGQGAVEARQEGMPPGMTLDAIADDPEAAAGAEGGDGVLAAKPQPERKTKQQRRKAAKLLAEKRALAEKAAKKRMLAAVSTARVLRRSSEQLLAERERAREARRAALQEKLKRGLVGRKLGRHKVPAGEVDVQLGEELSESLRALKPEGNLFRDRFLSLQQRALIEPRVPVIPPKRTNKTKEYEKHAWKRFDA